MVLVKFVYVEDIGDFKQKHRVLQIMVLPDYWQVGGLWYFRLNRFEIKCIPDNELISITDGDKTVIGEYARLRGIA